MSDAWIRLKALIKKAGLGEEADLLCSEIDRDMSAYSILAAKFPLDRFDGLDSAEKETLMEFYLGQGFGGDLS